MASATFISYLTDLTRILSVFDLSVWLLDRLIFSLTALARFLLTQIEAASSQYPDEES